MLRYLRALAVASVLVLPSPAQAQGHSQGHHNDPTPLRTLCVSPTMDYCVHFWTWDWFLHANYNNAIGHFRTDVDIFGHAITTGLFYVVALNGCGGDHYGAGGYEHPGPDTASDGPICTGGPGGPSTVADITGIMFFTPERAVTGIITCRTSLDGPPDGGFLYRPENMPHCYEVSVPEPSSLLLLATGLGGVVIAGRRRRAA